MRILEHYDIDVASKTAVIVGRSFLVGRPMALLLGAKGVDAPSCRPILGPRTWLTYAARPISSLLPWVASSDRS